MAHYLDSTGLTTLWAKIKALIPTSLKNPNALTMQANGTTVASYDGSSAKTVNITPASIGAAASSHTHSYLPLSGGTVTGNVSINDNPDGTALDVNGEGYIMNLTAVDIDSDSLHVTDNVAIGTDVDTKYALKVEGNTYVNGKVEAVNGIVARSVAVDSSITASSILLYSTAYICGNTTLSQLCTFSKSEAHFGVNGSYTDPYNGQAASFKFGGSIAATYGYFKNDVKANNIIVNGGNLSFIVNGTTYKLNMGKAVTLGLVTT